MKGAIYRDGWQRATPALVDLIMFCVSVFPFSPLPNIFLVLVSRTLRQSERIECDDVDLSIEISRVLMVRLKSPQVSRRFGFLIFERLE